MGDSSALLGGLWRLLRHQSQLLEVLHQFQGVTWACNYQLSEPENGTTWWLGRIRMHSQSEILRFLR